MPSPWPAALGLLLGVAFLASMPPPVAGSPVTIDHRVEADTIVNKTSPNQNHGAAETLSMRPNATYGFLLFNFTNVSPGFDQVSLILWSPGPEGTRNHTESVHGYADVNWSESGLTWANHEPDALSQRLDQRWVGNRSYTIFDVTDWTIRYEGMRGVSFMIAMDDDRVSEYHWYSRDGASTEDWRKPRLSLTYGYTGQPTTSTTWTTATTTPTGTTMSGSMEPSGPTSPSAPTDTAGPGADDTGEPVAIPSVGAAAAVSAALAALAWATRRRH